MGRPVVPDSNVIQHSIDGIFKAMVGDQEALDQGLPDTGFSGRGLNWTKILKEHNLETPGYHEVIAEMKKLGRIKTKSSSLG
jgi:hypothetical protein